jgi:hypothetical protein
MHRLDKARLSWPKQEEQSEKYRRTTIKQRDEKGQEISRMPTLLL